MFKLVTLALIGAVSCFNTEESTTMLKKAKATPAGEAYEAA